MRKKKHKIKIADTEEVARCGGATNGGTEADGQPVSPEAAESEATGVTKAEPSGEEQAPDEAAQLRAKVEELQDKHLRAVAELQNFRRRAAAETQETIRYASADLTKALLPVVDDLERSLAALSDKESSSLADGVKLVHQNLLKVLEAHHVQRIEAVGKPFDPAVHEAVMQQASEQYPPGTVLEECQPGYKLWDRVLRHTKVIVSKKVDAPDEDRACKDPGEKADHPMTEVESSRGKGR